MPPAGAAEEREESEQMEQEGDRRARIFSRFRADRSTTCSPDGVLAKDSSMELFADRDPEEARKILDPVLERMMEAVHRYEGTVNQVMGDGIMALFGAPLAHEDPAWEKQRPPLCIWNEAWHSTTRPATRRRPSSTAAMTRAPAAGITSR